MRAFHGTTHHFETFDYKSKGRGDGAFGHVTYFSSSFDDAKTFYTDKNEESLRKIDRDARESIEKDPTKTLAQAQQEHHGTYFGDTPQVIEVDVDLKRPYHIDGSHPAFARERYLSNPNGAEREEGQRDGGPLVFPEIQGRIEKAQNEIAQEYGYETAEDFQDSGDADYDDVEMDMFDAQDNIENRYTKKIEKSILKSLRSGAFTPGFDEKEVLGHATTRLPNVTRLGQNALYESLFKAGEHLTSQKGERPEAIFASLVVKNLGFDGIVMSDAQERWPAMKMPKDTTHIHVFAGQEDLITIQKRHLIQKDGQIITQDAETTPQAKKRQDAQR